MLDELFYAMNESKNITITNCDGTILYVNDNFCQLSKYEKEEIVDDLIIKKVNLNDLVNKNEETEIKEEVIVISYQKEEAFLSALKELNSLLN